MHANTSKSQHQECQYFMEQNKTSPDSTGASHSASKPQHCASQRRNTFENQKHKASWTMRSDDLGSKIKNKLKKIQFYCNSNKRMAGSHPIHSRVPIEDIYWHRETWLARRICSALFLPKEADTRSPSAHSDSLQVTHPLFPRVLPPLACAVMGHAATVRRHCWGSLHFQQKGWRDAGDRCLVFVCVMVSLSCHLPGSAYTNAKMQPLACFLPTDRHPPDDGTRPFERCSPHPKQNGSLGRDGGHPRPPQPRGGTWWPEAHEPPIQVPWSRRGTHPAAHGATSEEPGLLHGAPRSTNLQVSLQLGSSPRHTRDPPQEGSGTTVSPSASGEQDQLAAHQYTGYSYWGHSTYLLSRLCNGEPRCMLLTEVTRRRGLGKDWFSCLPKVHRKMGGWGKYFIDRKKKNIYIYTGKGGRYL